MPSLRCRETLVDAGHIEYLVSTSNDILILKIRSSPTNSIRRISHWNVRNEAHFREETDRHIG